MTTGWWMVRAGDNNELIPSWLQSNVASIGWSELGNPIKYRVREDLIERCHTVYHDEKPGARILWGSQVWRFSHEIQLGDRIVTYAKDSREYLVGTVKTAYQYAPAIIDDYYPNVVGVSWESERISRDSLTQGAKNSLGGISTVFRIDQWASEFENLLKSTSQTVITPIADESEDDMNSEELLQQIRTMVEDKVDKLDPWQMQDLVGGVLQAMGYQVRVSPKGRDGGIDILAHRDAFGFEQPIIKVQVKHRRSTVSSAEVQQLLGTNPIGASSLFVSTGGFTSSAISIAQQNGVKLLDLSQLVELLLNWYDQIPDEIKSLVPLRKTFLPL
jgi:restriction system protein